MLQTQYYTSENVDSTHYCTMMNSRGNADIDCVIKITICCPQPLPLFILNNKMQWMTKQCC